MGRLFSFSCAFACAGALVLACGGSTSSGITDPAAGDAGTSSADGGSGTTTTYTLDNVCELTAPKVCALRKPCCEKTFGYDEAGCIAEAKADCAKDVADARGGRMTFHPERVDPCLAKFQSILDGCYETVDLLYRAFEITECRVFEGQLTDGAKCERDSQCAPASGPSAFVDCNDERKVCTVTRLLEEGAACAYGDGSPGFCAKGLYCDAPLGQSNAGTCKKATPLGADCNKNALLSLECGLGAYCDRTSGKCTTAKGDGAPCDTALECQSLSCEGTGGPGKTCQKAKPIVDENECK